MTPNELIDEHVFGPRVHEEVGDLRRRLANREARLKMNPTDKVLQAEVGEMRTRLRTIEGHGLDPGARGANVPGVGSINTRAAIQVIYPDGKIIVERGSWGPSHHAEEDALAKLRIRLGTQELPAGTRIMVGGNQVVCDKVCKPEIARFAKDYGVPLENVSASVRTRPKIVGNGWASGKTTERTGLRNDVPKATVKTEPLFPGGKEPPAQTAPPKVSAAAPKAPSPPVTNTLAKPPAALPKPATPSAPVQAPPVSVTSSAATPKPAPPLVPVQEPPVATGASPAVRSTAQNTPQVVSEVIRPGLTGVKQSAPAHGGPIISLTSSTLQEAQTLRAQNTGAIVAVGAGYLAGFALEKYREWMEQSLAAIPPIEIGKESLAVYFERSAAAMNINNLLSKEIDSFAEDIEENSKRALSSAAAEVILLIGELSAAKRIKMLGRLNTEMGSFQNEVFKAKQSINAALELESIGHERIKAANDLADVIINKAGRANVIVWDFLVKKLSVDEIVMIHNNLRDYAGRIRSLILRLHELQVRTDNAYVEIVSFSYKLNKIYWSEVLAHTYESKAETHR